MRTFCQCLYMGVKKVNCFYAKDKHVKCSRDFVKILHAISRNDLFGKYIWTLLIEKLHDKKCI